MSVSNFLTSALACLVVIGAQANQSDQHHNRTIAALGGDLEISWNHSLLENLHINLSAPIDSAGQTLAGFDRFPLSEASEITVVTEGQSVRELSAGVVAVRGGYNMVARDVTLAIKDFTLRRRPGTTPVFDLVTPFGETPFFVDNLLVEPGADGQSIAVRTMDLKISRWLALRLGNPEVTSWPIATLRMQAHLAAHDASPLREGCPDSKRWPSMPVPRHPSEQYKVDVFMESFVPQLTGCADCTGPGGNGRLKITPTTILRNNVNDGTADATVSGDVHGTSSVKFAADVPWRNMFSANCAPYGNDQHPFLTWALYRINSQGQLEQLAYAGVKHAHTAQNGQCIDNPSSNHVLGRGCTDVYGVGDNDASDAMGPRSEIIPATGQWGRCGSIYDPKCSGKLSGFAGPDPWKYRLAVPESEIAGKNAEGAKFFLEAWYIVRDDVDAHNGMANMPIEFVWEPTNRLWVVKPAGLIKLGSVIDGWVDPLEHGPDSDNRELRTAHGHLKVAVRTKKTKEGNFHYDFAVMNLDYDAGYVKGVAPNQRIVNSHGVNAITIAAAPDTMISKPSLVIYASERAGTWPLSSEKNAIKWTAASQSELRWGTLLRFSYDLNNFSCETRVSLHSIEPSGKQAYVFRMFVPPDSCIGNSASH